MSQSTRLQYIIDSGTMIFNGIEETIENHFRPNNPSFLLASVKDIANIIADKMGIKRVAPSTDRTMDEIKYYLNTGDFEPKTENIVCFNPTLLTLGDKLWQVRKYRTNQLFVIATLLPKY